MNRTFIGAVTLLGGGVGAISSMRDGIGLVFVMGTIGAAFGCAIGSGLCAITNAIFRFAKKIRLHGKGSEEADFGDDLGAANYFPKYETDNNERFPIAGDLEITSRAKTGSPDLVNLNRHHGF